jgi:hypothetical protein
MLNVAITRQDKEVSLLQSNGTSVDESFVPPGHEGESVQETAKSKSLV